MCLLNQKCKAVALLPEKPIAQFPDIGIKRRAIARFPFVKEPLRARWITEIKNRCLDESVSRAAAGRVQRIAFEFDRTSINGRRDERNCPRPSWHRGRVVEKFSGDCPLHVLRKRNQVCFRSPAAIQTKTSQSHRCA